MLARRYDGHEILDLDMTIMDHPAFLCLRKAVERTGNIPDQYWQVLSQKARIANFRKGEHLSIAGDTPDRAGFVTSGAFLSTYIHHNAKESILDLHLPDFWIGDAEGFFKRSPAKLSFVALTDSEVICFDPSIQQTIAKDMPLIMQYLMSVILDALLRLERKMLVFQFGTAEEKYDFFLTHYQDAAELMSQVQIAAFLGITPEFLSGVIRKKRSVKLV